MTQPENQAEALKNCPFCGGEAKLYPPTYHEENSSEVIGPACVNCHDCCAAVLGTWEDDAIEAWNRRASLPEARAVSGAMPGLAEAVEFTRADLGETGTNYPHVRALLAFAEDALQSSPPVNAAPDRAMLERAHDWMADNIREADIEGATVLGYLANYLHDAPVTAAAVDDIRKAVRDFWVYDVNKPSWFSDEQNDRLVTRILAALAFQDAVEGEAVAWRWRLPSDEKWQFTDGPDKPRLGLPTSFEEAAIKEPLYASPGPDAADAGVREALVDALTYSRDRLQGNPTHVADALAKIDAALSLAAKRGQE